MARLEQAHKRHRRGIALWWLLPVLLSASAHGASVHDFDLQGAALPGPGFEYAEGSYAATPQGLQRRRDTVSGTRGETRYLRTARTDLVGGDWNLTLEFTLLPGAPDDVVYVGLGSAREGPHDNAPMDGLVLRLHQGGSTGNGTGHRVDLVAYDGPSAMTHFETLGHLPPGPASTRLRVELTKIGRQITFHFESPLARFAKVVWDIRQTAPTLLQGETRLFFGNATEGVRYERVAFQQNAPASPAPRVDLQATPAMPRAGESVQLTWSAEDASVCHASGDWSGDLDASGSRFSAVLYNHINQFTLTCDGREANTTRTLEVVAEGGRQSMPLLLSGGDNVPGFDARLGQRRARLAATRNGNVVALFGQGFPQDCPLFGSCGEPGSTWHLALNQRGLVSTPRRSWPALDALPGLNNSVVFPGNGVPYGDGSTAIFAMTHSGHNALGGNFLQVDGQGNVLARRRGQNAYGGWICSIGPHVVMPAQWVDPLRQGYTWWNQGQTAERTVMFPPPLTNDVRLADILCGFSQALQGPYVVLASSRRQQYIELQLFRAPGAEWTPVGPPVRISANPRGFWNTAPVGIALGDDMGVLLLTDKAADGRDNLYHARFRVTAAGLEVLDDQPRTLFVSPSYEGRDGAVTYGGDGRFYLATYHAGRPAAGEPPNHRQSIRSFALDFREGSLQMLAPAWEDERWSATPVRGYYSDDLLIANFSIVKSCDGAVYLAGSVDNGEGRGLLKLFRIPVGPASCGPTPQVKARVRGSQGRGYWYTSDVLLEWEVDLRGEQELSRSGCEPVHLTQDTAGVQYHCRVVTTAGEVQDSVTLQRDATPPSAEFNLRPLPNREGWHSAPVTIDFRGQDATSGIAQCSTGDVLNAEGDGQISIEGRCTDLAGNVSAPVQARGIRIDRTAPQVEARPRGAPNTQGWFSAPVTVVFSGKDALSGVAPEGCDAPTLLARSGRGQSASGQCVDRAGNRGRGTLGGVDIDLAAPLAMASVEPLANAAGWHRQIPTVRFAGVDRLSGAGISACTAPVRVTQDVTARQVRGYCTDRAGHASNAVIEVINLDRIAPTLRLQIPASGAVYARGSRQTVDFGCADERSGIERCSATHPDGTLLDTSRPGEFSFVATATDQAGNETRGQVTYRID